MSDQLIDQIVDRQAISSDQDFVDGVLDDIFSKFKNVADLKIKLTADSSFQAAAKTVAAVKQNQDDLSLSVQQYNKILDTTAIAQAKFAANTSDAAKANATAKVALAAQNQELTATAKLQATANNSVGEAIALVNQLKIARNAISIVDEASKQKVADLNTQIDLNNKFINENTSNIEKQKNNVGNYIGAVSILKGALDEVNAKIEANTQAGLGNNAAQQQLIKEQQLLTTAVGRQSEGFSSLSVELRTNQQLLATMSAAGLKGTKAFDELRGKVDDAQREFNQFRLQQKELASETPGLQAILKAAEGLVGIYGAAVSAAKLFGDENDDLKEGMVKLEAVIALLNSLQAINRTLHESTAIAVGIEEAARNGLAVATRLYTYVTEAATAATYGFRAALVATGIGALIALLVSFVANVYEAVNSTSKAADEQKKYNDVLKEFNDIIGKNNTEYLSYLNLTKEGLNDQLGLLQAQKAGFESLQAVKLAIAQQDIINSKKGLENLGLSVDKVGILRDQYDQLQIKIQAYYDIAATAAKKAADEGEDPEKDRGVRTAKAQIAALQAEAEALKARFEPGQQLIDQNDKGTQSYKELTAELIAFKKEQQANLSENTAKTSLQIIIDANSAIVSDTRKTENERLQALKNGAAAQQAFELATLTRQNATPGLSDQQKIINAQTTAAAILKIGVELTKNLSDTVRTYSDADYQIQKEIAKAEATDQITKNAVIIADEKNSYASREAAALDTYRKQIAIAADSYKQEINDKTLTTDQLAAADAKYNTASLAAKIELNKINLELTTQNNDKILQDGITAGEKNLALIKSQYDEQIVALNNLREKDLIGETKYQQQRAAIDAKYAEQELQVEIQNAYLKVNSTRVGTAERAKAEQDLADLVAKLSDNEVKAVENAEKKKQEAILGTLTKIENSYNRITDILGKALDAQITAQKNAIQSQINSIKDKENAEIQAVDNQVLSETDKAAKIGIIQANAQAQTEALQRRQKQLDVQKAEFDKIKTIGTIILKTAEAIVSDLGDPPKIVFDAAIGAAELAIAIAAPIPTYMGGGVHVADGPAILGDGGRSEMAVLPDGSLYMSPAYDTLVPHLPANTVIHPDARKFLADLPESAVYSSGGRQPNGLEQVFVKGMGKIVQAINEKEELHIHPNFSSIMAIHKYGNSWVEWVNQNVHF